MEIFRNTPHYLWVVLFFTGIVVFVGLYKLYVLKNPTEKQLLAYALFPVATMFTALFLCFPGEYTIQGTATAGTREKALVEAKEAAIGAIPKWLKNRKYSPASCSRAGLLSGGAPEEKVEKLNSKKWRATLCFDVDQYVFDRPQIKR